MLSPITSISYNENNTLNYTGDFHYSYNEGDYNADSYYWMNESDIPLSEFVMLDILCEYEGVLCIL